MFKKIFSFSLAAVIFFGSCFINVVSAKSFNTNSFFSSVRDSSVDLFGDHLFFVYNGWYYVYNTSNLYFWYDSNNCFIYFSSYNFDSDTHIKYVASRSAFDVNSVNYNYFYHTFDKSVSFDDFYFCYDRINDSIFYFYGRDFSKSYVESVFLNSSFSSSCLYIPDGYLTSSSLVGPTLPSGSLWGSHVRYSTNDLENFIFWFKENKKINDIKSSGLNLAEAEIDKLIDWWNNYGNLPALQKVAFLPKLFMSISAPAVGVDVITTVCSVLDQLYSDYKHYFSTTYILPDSTVKPHYRQSKEDDTTDSYDLVVDSDDDTIDLSILREILRTLIYIPGDVYNLFSSYLDALVINQNKIIWLLADLPANIAVDCHDLFSSDIDNLIAAINNINTGGSSEPSEPNDLNSLFQDYHTQYVNKINSKIPCLTQLSGIFNDDFFEKCGIDINNDGQTYSYYSAVSLSSSDLPQDANLINDFISKFDGADPNFLDDAAFSEDVPDWSISISGQKTQIFSFKLYAKYRNQIHAVIIFVISTFYFLSLYKSMPDIIGKVADVRNIEY